MAHIKPPRQTKRGIRYDVARGPRSWTFKTLEEALLAQLAVERGEEPSRVLPDSTTVGEFWVAWETRWRQGKSRKTIRAAESARVSLADVMPLRLSQLRAATVEDTISTLAQTAPRQAQLSLAHLKRCLRSAQGRDHKIDPRILALPNPSYESGEIRFLTWDEVESLQSFLDPRVNRIVPVAALTGMRRGELYDLTDTRVDLTEGSVTLRKTKTGKPRKVWLSDTAKQLLREQLVARTPTAKGYVFPTPSEGARLGSRFEHSYREAVKHAGLDGATFHSLRHTCASLMIAAGCNPLEIAEQLGHMRGGKPDATMIWQRYGWLYSGATQKAVKSLDVLIHEAPAEEAVTA